jgi:hypothetical protein
MRLEELKGKENNNEGNGPFKEVCPGRCCFMGRRRWEKISGQYIQINKYPTFNIASLRQ